MSKKYLLLVLMSAVALTGCEFNFGDNSNQSTTDKQDSSSIDSSTVDSSSDSQSSETKNVKLTDDASITYAFDTLYGNNCVRDAENGFNTKSDVKYAKIFRNGDYVTEFTSSSSRQDIKMELYNDNATRFVNVSNGYEFTLPTTDVAVDYSIANYRTQFTFDDSILSVSFESKNPYTALSNPWYTYISEWLIAHIQSDDFISNQGLKRFDYEKYNFTAAHSVGNTTFKTDYDCYFYNILIDGDKNQQIERPFYNIAIIRQANDVKNFALFVMKSKVNYNDTNTSMQTKTNLMKKIIKSYSKISAKGVSKNYFYSQAATPNPNWSEETRNYFDYLLNTEYVNWGVFSYSMPADAGSLKPGQSNYDNFLKWAQAAQTELETKMAHKYEIYPTYTHLGGYETSGRTYFSLNQANALAGGNGVNGKPVLQFTFQFTTNNNLVSYQVTPMFDILRGKYDDVFRDYAKDIKAYGKPILFRLNNEMNTDWTSYCGMMTLLDPDIFSMTWQRMYDIFQEEGVDNCIWIFNPIATSCPYSSWGEDMCYFPGLDYVQLLGGTNYEFNNYSAATAAKEIKSFKKLYTDLYLKNSESFSSDWKLIISEFACGSGGAASGRLGRNVEVQANWVKGMFEEMNAAEPADYIKQIRGAVWFNANDYSGNLISNRLQLCEKPINKGEKYDDLDITFAQFKKGFEDQDKRLGK